MKTFALTIIALLVGLYVQAQTEQGKLFISGSISITNKTEQANKDLKNNSFAFLPSVGYFVADRLALELSAGYSSYTYSTLINTGGDPSIILLSQTDKTLSVGPAVRYFIGTGNEKFFFSPRLSVLVGFTKSNITSTTTSESSTVRYTDYTASLSPGFSYFPTSHWGINLNAGGLSYLIEHPNGTSDSNTSTFAFNLFSSTSIGVSYFF